MRVTKRIIALIFLLLFSPRANAQSTTVSGTVSDTPDAQTWNNGTVTVAFNPNPNYPSLSSYTWTGGTINPTVSGTLTGTGTYSLSIPSSTAISPQGSTWSFNFCPQATATCFSINSATITGGTQTLNATPPSIRVNWQNPPSIVRAYTDTEVSAGANIGSQYFNLVSVANKVCTAVSGNSCTVWGASGGGPSANLFNVKNLGGSGDWQSTGNASVSYVNGATTVTCASCNFQNGKTKVGMGLFGNSTNGSLQLLSPNCSIASITSNTVIALSTGCTAQATLAGDLLWGTFGNTATSVSNDDTATTSAFTSALAASVSLGPSNGSGGTASAPIVYFPAGGYLFCNVVANANKLSVGNNASGFIIQGDGLELTRIYLGSGTQCPGNVANYGYFFTTQSGTGAILVKGMTLDGGNNNTPGGNSNAIYFGGGGRLEDVAVTRVANAAATVNLNGKNIEIRNVQTVGNQQQGILCLACSGEARFSSSSNNANAPNLVFQNVTGLNAGAGFRWYGGLIDECGTLLTGCTQFINSTDGWLIGASLFGTPGGFALSVDGNSSVHFNGGIAGSFGTDAGTGGISVAAGGTLEASDVRMVATGTGKCAVINGLFINNGANSCESQFTIASGSESVNTVSLTVNTLGSNLNTVCAIGDTAVVQNAATAGYNGKFRGAITAVGTTTVSYTNPASGLGAIGAAGTFYCLNNRSTLLTGAPTQTLAPSNQDCRIPTLTATTTTATTNCFWTPDRDIFVTRFSAGLETAPSACATNAVLQISNGTSSQNLTLTAAQNDSGSISPPILFAAGAKIGVIVQTAASGCTVTPANANYDFRWSGGFDN